MFLFNNHKGFSVLLLFLDFTFKFPMKIKKRIFRIPCLFWHFFLPLSLVTTTIVHCKERRGIVPQMRCEKQVFLFSQLSVLLHARVLLFNKTKKRAKKKDAATSDQSSSNCCSHNKYVWPRTTDARWGNCLHCTAENTIPIPNF